MTEIHYVLQFLLKTMILMTHCEGPSPDLGRTCASEGLWSLSFYGIKTNLPLFLPHFSWLSLHPNLGGNSSPRINQLPLLVLLNPKDNFSKDIVKNQGEAGRGTILYASIRFHSLLHIVLRLSHIICSHNLHF